MSLPPVARTEARSKLAQALDPSNRLPHLERLWNEALLQEIQTNHPEPWTKTRTERLSDDQLQKVLRIIVETATVVDPSWCDNHNSDQSDVLRQAEIAEPTIKECLQECWADGDFSLVRHAGYWWFMCSS